MKVKHKVSGKTFEVSQDYFEKYEDTLEVLEVVPEKKTTKGKGKGNKQTGKQTKVIEPAETKETTEEDAE